MKHKIVFAWGGTWWHINPSIAIADNLKWFEVLFIISRSKNDKNIVKASKYRYESIFSGKLRRYFSIYNLIDIPLILIWIIQSIIILAKFKPNLVFAKWGFVSVPVALSAKLLRIPIILHESDAKIWLSGRIISHFATRTINWMLDWLNPIRKEAFNASPQEWERILWPSINWKQILLVMWWSQGAKQLNDLIVDIFHRIKHKYFVVHLTWIWKSTQIMDLSYAQFEYLWENYFHILSRSDIIISRAWANSLSEILHFRKPSIIIPLNLSAQDHQRANAALLEQRWLIINVEPNTLDPQAIISHLLSDKEISKIQNNLNRIESNNWTDRIIEIISKELIKHQH